MAFAISKITACVCVFCAAEMAGELIRNLSENLPIKRACPRLWCRPELIRNLSENLPVEGACPRLWCRPGKLDIPSLGGEGGGEKKKGFTAICCKPLNLLVRPKRFELLTYRFVAYI